MTIPARIGQSQTALLRTLDELGGSATPAELAAHMPGRQRPLPTIVNIARRAQRNGVALGVSAARIYRL